MGGVAAAPAGSIGGCCEASLMLSTCTCCNYFMPSARLKSKKLFHTSCCVCLCFEKKTRNAFHVYMLLIFHAFSTPDKAGIGSQSGSCWLCVCVFSSKIMQCFPRVHAATISCRNWFTKRL